MDDLAIFVFIFLVTVGVIALCSENATWPIKSTPAETACIMTIIILCIVFVISVLPYFEKNQYSYKYIQVLDSNFCSAMVPNKYIFLIFTALTFTARYHLGWPCTICVLTESGPVQAAQRKSIHQSPSDVFVFPMSRNF